MDVSMCVVEVSSVANEGRAIYEFFDESAAWRHAEAALFEGREVTVKIVQVPLAIYESTIGRRIRRAR